jgi:hypothetical protein
MMPASGIEVVMYCSEVRWNVSRNTRGVLGNDRNQLKPKLLVPGGGIEPPQGFWPLRILSSPQTQNQQVTRRAMDYYDLLRIPRLARLSAGCIAIHRNW